MATDSIEGTGLAPEASPPTRDDGNGVFGGLVTSNDDVAGLVAYSIYKQNKLDWLRAFERSESREPNEAEIRAYVIGEGTPRRLASYRHLAESTLAGNGPGADGAANPIGYREAAPRGVTMPYPLAAVLFVVLAGAVALAAKYLLHRP